MKELNINRAEEINYNSLVLNNEHCSNYTFGIEASFNEMLIVISEILGKEGTRVVLQEIPIAFDDYELYLCMADDECGYLLYCSSPAAGQMHKIIYSTVDRWKTYKTIDISLQIDGYPNSFTLMSREAGYIGVNQRNKDYMYATKDSGMTWQPVIIDKCVTSCNGFAPVFEESNAIGIAILDLKTAAKFTYAIYESNDKGVSWHKIGEVVFDVEMEGFYLCDNQINIEIANGEKYIMVLE